MRKSASVASYMVAQLLAEYSSPIGIKSRSLLGIERLAKPQKIAIVQKLSALLMSMLSRNT